MGPKVRPARENEFPFVVSIGNANPIDAQRENHFCTGSLITRLLVLTSAHCLEDETTGTLQITVGTIDLRGGTKYYAQSWITYDDWYSNIHHEKPGGENDIAIITVNQVLLYNSLNRRTLLQLP